MKWVSFEFLQKLLKKNSLIGTFSFEVTCIRDVLLSVHGMPLNDFMQIFSDVSFFLHKAHFRFFKNSLDKRPSGNTFTIKKLKIVSPRNTNF